MILKVPQDKRRKKAAKKIIKIIISLSKLDECTYDGIRGTLPEWMPQLFVKKFKKIRSKLLTRYSYTPSQIKRYITRYPEYMRNLKPEMMSVEIPNRILDDIDELYVLKYAVNAGEQDGLSILLDGKTADQIVTGKKFLSGRKSNSIGPVRKFIRNALKKNPEMKNADLWEAIKERPPRGWDVMENSRFYKYIEKPNSGDNVGWKRFCNIAAEERNLQKSRVSEGGNLV